MVSFRVIITVLSVLSCCLTTVDAVFFNPFPWLRYVTGYSSPDAEKPALPRERKQKEKFDEYAQGIMRADAAVELEILREFENLEMFFDSSDGLRMIRDWRHPEIWLHDMLLRECKQAFFGSDLSNIELILSHGERLQLFNINSLPAHHVPPLILACDQKNLELVKLLLDHGADVDKLHQIPVEHEWVWGTLLMRAVVDRQPLMVQVTTHFS